MSRWPGLSPKVWHSRSAMRRQVGSGCEVARVAHVGDQADQVVLVRPHVPLGPAVLLQIGAEVAVSSWHLQSSAAVSSSFRAGPGRRIDPRQAWRRAAICRRARHPRPAGPDVSGSLPAGGRVQLHQPVGFVGRDARADPPGQLHAVGTWASCRSATVQGTFSGTGVIGPAMAPTPEGHGQDANAHGHQFNSWCVRLKSHFSVALCFQ